MIYVEVLKCDNTTTSQVPHKILENTLRFTRSEEDLSQLVQQPVNGSPRPEFSVYGTCQDFDDADCWSQEDDEIIAVSFFFHIKTKPQTENLQLLTMQHYSCPKINFVCNQSENRGNNLLIRNGIC